MSVIFNGSTGLVPFTNKFAVRDDLPDPEVKLSRPVGQELMLLLLLMPPVRVRIESRTPTTARLVWSHIIVNTQNVEIDRALGDGSFSNIAILPGGIGTYIDTGLTEGTRYRYRLRLT